VTCSAATILEARNCITLGSSDPLLDANGVPAANSPAVNAGSNTYLPADVADVDGDGDTAETLPLDYAGNARVQGGTVDIGAYEVN
jgi:hypothetical protein